MSEEKDKKTFGLSIPAETLKTLKRLALETDTTPGKVICHALDEWWNQHPEYIEKWGKLFLTPDKTEGSSGATDVEVNDGD